MTNPSPLRYPGGKYKTYNYIKSLIKSNKSTSYIEPFAGGAAVALKLILEKVVKRIIINDFDRSIYALWYSIIYHTEELITLIQETPITMEEWERQKKVQNNKTQEPLLTLGFSTLFLNRTNRSGIIKAGVIGGKEQLGQYTMDCRFPKQNIINKILEIAAHKENIQVYNMNAIEFIDKVIKKTRKSFTFFDPPYFQMGPSLYVNFYKIEDHIDLSKKIKTELKNRKWIVTYDNAIEIRDMYIDLDFIEYYLNYTAQDKKKGIEYMFFSKETISDYPEKYLKLHHTLFSLEND
jgi:DNA adenine methylase